MLLFTLIASFSCSNDLKVRKGEGEGSVIRLYYGNVKRQLLCFSVHRKLLCWTNIFQDPGTLLSGKNSQDGKKKAWAYSFWSLLTWAAVDVCAWAAHNLYCTVLAPHSVCSRCWMQLERGCSNSADRGQGGLHTFLGPGQEHRQGTVLIWYTQGICTHEEKFPGLRIEFIQPRKMCTYWVEKLWKLVTLVCYPSTENEAG